MRFGGLALFPHLLQEGFDRHLKLVPEQIDECIFGAGAFVAFRDFGCGSLGCKDLEPGKTKAG